MKPEYITPACFGHFPELVALQSTRRGGASSGHFSSLNLGINTPDEQENVRENTRILSLAAGYDPSTLVSGDQVHGTSILHAEKPGRYNGYDAFITGCRNLFLCIYTADCFPVLLYDPVNRAAGAVHAGWKGTAGGIVMKTLDAMHGSFGTNPSQCVAWIGAGISRDAYEVGAEVAGAFHSDCCAPSAAASGNEKYLLDLSLSNYRQLLVSGVRDANIERSPFCTFRDSSLFFSYRRDKGLTGRMASIIGMKQGF
ncbi:MAG: peptidoglycan editing factor PgeF [Chlorobiaceae bacterium]|nr:peptidoglycan editing factor PgeF [Chlorobiaceae bacterium]NTW09840.1 peptidoglycan editing factor PgeF [Chlorobiaceae bacterium]